MSPPTQIAVFSVLAVASALRLAYLFLKDDLESDNPIPHGIILSAICLWSLIFLARAISLL